MATPSRASASDGDSDFRLKVTIPSDDVSGRAVQNQIMDSVIRKGFNHQCIFAIKLALEEAVNNAITHGNARNKKKRVHIEAVITRSKADIIVEDEGPGFDRGCVPDPTLDENLEKCSGRGILLIEAYMSQVRWTKGGRRVHMIKKNEPDTLPRS